MLEGVFIIFLIAAVLVGVGIWLLTSFTALILHIVGIVLIIAGVVFLLSRLFGSRRGTGTPL